MSKSRTVIPTKNIDTVEVGPYRANLRRWEHWEGQLPIYTIEIWKGWTLVSSAEYGRIAQHYVAGTIEGDHQARDERWQQMREELATMIAKEALGLPLPKLKREV